MSSRRRRSPATIVVVLPEVAKSPRCPVRSERRAPVGGHPFPSRSARNVDAPGAGERAPRFCYHVQQQGPPRRQVHARERSTTGTVAAAVAAFESASGSEVAAPPLWQYAIRQ